jgi:hypothetical protein
LWIGGSRRKCSGHHEDVASAFEQHTVEFVGHFYGGQREFSSRHPYKPLFDEPNQDDTGEEREYGHDDKKVGQPAIAAKIEK